MNHQTSFVPQIAYQSLQVSTQLMTESPLVDSCFDVPVFSLGDDLIAYLNKAMAFLTAIASSRGNNASGQARVVKCYNCQGEGHMARQCTQPRRPQNTAWYKDKAMLAEAQEAGQILDEEQLTDFLVDPGGSTATGSHGQTFPLCVMTVYLSEVPHSETYLNDIENQAFLVAVHDQSTLTSKPSDASPVKIEAPKELPKDLKAQILDKVYVITSLKNDLRKVKGKEIVDIVAQIPSANTIVLGMFKIDLEPMTARLLQNREAHVDYLKYTQEQADIL
ncbi:retrovirus-related pol polyprotein from transposon TNT 1-94 [Tanacetum coccineum]